MNASPKPRLWPSLMFGAFLGTATAVVLMGAAPWEPESKTACPKERCAELCVGDHCVLECYDSEHWDRCMLPFPCSGTECGECPASEPCEGQ
jgi:hypothetical protein